MIAVVAGNHDEFEAWLREQFVYVGDKDTIDSLNPADIDSFAFVGNFRDHPIYFSDDLLKFQIECAAARMGLDAEVTFEGEGEDAEF